MEARDRPALRGSANGSIVLGGLTVLTAALAGALVLTGRASFLEGVSFVTGAVCVWLTVRASVWNFPIGLLNIATFSVVFFEARLFGDAALQVVYFLLGLSGWYLWLHGGEGRTPLPLSRAPRRELLRVCASCAVATIVLWQGLHAVGGSSSFWDAATTSVSLGAQWLLNGKRLENWHLWIVVDAVYIPLYLSRGLALTALLYAVFLVMAVVGLSRWRGLIDKEIAAASHP